MSNFYTDWPYLESVGDADTPEEIVEKFKEVHEELYNSIDTSAAVNLIKDKLEEMVDADTFEINKITPEVVKKEATLMKLNEADVTGSFTSDLLLYAPYSMYLALAAVFRSWLVHGTVSRHLLVCAFMPVLKSDLKDPSSTDSYRAIAGYSQVLKLFDNVVLLVWGHLLHSDSQQFLSSSQGASIGHYVGPSVVGRSVGRSVRQKKLKQL